MLLCVSALQHPRLPSDDDLLLQLVWLKAVVSCVQHMRGSPVADLALEQLHSAPGLGYYMSVLAYRLLETADTQVRLASRFPGAWGGRSSGLGRSDGQQEGRLLVGCWDGQQSVLLD